MKNTHTIRAVHAREILDSRGNPTIEADIILESGSLGRAAVPSGASTGSHEAKELRDGGKRYAGKGVIKAVAHVNGDIAGALVKKSFDQGSLDATLLSEDGTEDKSRLGANALLAVSLAFSRAVAQEQNVPLYQHLAHVANIPFKPTLPVPLMNVLNGGKHADGSSDFQEYMLVPGGFDSFSEALRAGTEIYHSLKSILKKRGLPTTVGDEGGFAPPVPSNEEPLALLVEAVEVAGYKVGKQIAFAMDAAASELYKDSAYTLTKDNETLSAKQLADKYASYAKKYPIVSIEDPFFEDDFETTTALTKKLSGKTQIVGDDLFTTNVSRLTKGIKEKAGTAILVKVNQIGTLTEAISAITLAKKAKLGTVASHRSGETEDAFISHLAVGLAMGQIKTGASARSERTAKYNELLRIEEALGKRASYPGFDALKK